MTILKRSPAFWLGFSAALGLLLATSVLAFATNNGSRAAADDYTAHGTHRVSPANTPLPTQLKAFSTSATAKNKIPAQVAAKFGELSGQGGSLGPGVVDAAGGRILMSDVGSWLGTLYAAPTSKAKVCYYLTGGPQTCAEAFTQNQPVAVSTFDADGLHRGHPTSVVGLAPNDVTAITVRSGTASYPARLANNSFFLELPTADDYPDALVIDYADGTRLTMPLGPE